jgi:2,4-dienoyl-CoA reductase (NADPH2)
MLKLLFTPIKVGTMELKNRIVMPAMHFLSSWEGKVLPHHLDYFGERAKGGAALIIVGGCTIDETSGAVNMLSAKDDRFIPGLAGLAEAVQAQDAKIAAQLYHAGRYPFGPGLRAKPLASFRSRRFNRSRGITPWLRLESNGPVSTPWKSSPRPAT